MNLTLKVWRQKNNQAAGTLETYQVKEISSEMSFLEMFDVLNRVIQAGGFISVNTGNAVDANCLPIDKKDADDAFMAASCIGCGACVATCVNSSAMLFVSAKVSQLALLPQGAPERESRVLNMVAQMDKENFGNCTNTYACEAECPKGISVANIARMNKEYLHAGLNTES